MIRIRHASGTATIRVDEDTTLENLQKSIQSLSEIEPELQEIKLGYPPRILRLQGLSKMQLVSEPPLSLKKGEQLIVARKGSSSQPAPSPVAAQKGTTTSQSALSFRSRAAPAAQSSSSAKDAITGPPIKSTSFIPPPSANPPSPVKDGEVFVDHDGMYLTLKVVPDDNACLFNAVGFAFHQRLGADICSELRHVCSTVIMNDPEYSDVVLGMDPKTYAAKILLPKTWGGAVELAILADHFATEITSVDIASNAVYRFGEDKGYSTRCIVIYSGIHYDALVLLPSPGAPVEFGSTLFEASTPDIIASAQKLCSLLKARRAYTDVANFSLQCKTCGKCLQGEKGATAHASETGHTDFGEV